MAPQFSSNRIIRQRQLETWSEDLLQQRLIPGRGLTCRRSCAGTVIEADRTPQEPSWLQLPAPFEITTDAGAGKISMAAGSVLYLCGGGASELQPVPEQVIPLPPEPGAYLLTLICQYNISGSGTLVWLSGNMSFFLWSCHNGLYRIPIAGITTAAVGDTVQVTALKPYCRSMPVIHIPDFPFRAVMRSPAPTPYSVCTGADFVPNELRITGGIAPFVSRSNWPAENGWHPVPDQTWKLGENGLTTLDGMYVLRLDKSNTGICVLPGSLADLEANGGKTWNEADGSVYIPICRVLDQKITQYTGFSQYAVPLYDPES